MNYTEVAVEPPFDRLIRCVWFLTGRSAEYRPQPVVPDGRLELLVHRADAFSRVHSDGSIQLQETVLIAGQLTGPIHLQPGSMIDVVGIRLTPLGAHAILDLPLNELTNAVVGLRDVHPRLASILATEAHLAGSHRERARAILELVGRNLVTGIDPFMEHADRSLSAGASLAVVAGHSGVTMRTLQRRFHREVGLSPKMYQRVVRFRTAFRMLSGAGVGSWAQVAVRTGYYDQAHLIRDFSQFAGEPPTSFFRSDPSLARAFVAANHGNAEPAV